MGTITIRRLDDDVIDRLKERAARNGRSMEEEARIVYNPSAIDVSVKRGCLRSFRKLARRCLWRPYPAGFCRCFS